jgi:glycosyltransferase involved in cell wall biosynthesis
MQPQLLVFDSHPVQYRVPIWQMMENQIPGSVHVVYASDCSVTGYADDGFSEKITWDEPMLSGYQHTIIKSENGKPLTGWGSLTGRGVKDIIKKHNPTAILLTGLNYQYDLIAYIQSYFRNIPLWLRCETQDWATYRSLPKSVVRTLIYNLAYLPFNKIFYIGELNRQHYIKHNVTIKKLKPALYCTVDRFERMSLQEKIELRTSKRNSLAINSTDYVVGFSGKFIPKKNPELLYKMLDHLPQRIRQNTKLYFVGSGYLKDDLQLLADHALKKYNVQSYFAGFVNQSQIAEHYLLIDTLVLPSQRMGETWGLVTNEAMQAGCGVVVSDAVGCSKDFAEWERFKIFKTGDSKDLADCIKQLIKFSRDFDWAKQGLENYSLKATADALVNELIESHKEV